jgi:hypothetical protein
LFLLTEKSVLPFEIKESKDTVDRDKNKIKAGLKKKKYLLVLNRLMK